MNTSENSSGFLGLESKYREKKSAPVYVLPVPYEATTTYGAGTRFAPSAIIRASQQIETFDEEMLCDPSRRGIHTLKEIEAHTGGPELMTMRIYSYLKKLIPENKFILALGGEHTITIGIVKAFREFFSNMCVLQIDAHLDLRPSYLGTHFNHACVMRRVMEICPVIQVGIRSMSEEEYKFIKKEKLKPVTMREIRRTKGWMKKVLSTLKKNIYISFDLDGFDPSVLRCVGTPEPGGLQWEETIEFLRLVYKRFNVIGADIVELTPTHVDEAGVYTAARLAYKFIAYWMEHQVL